MNLFDLNTKYADVLPVSDVIDYIDGLPLRKELKD
jgi:hypothetical protein